ncbi:hypothetical protein BKA93DRAFT_750760 [Sparassis latifolia]
MSKISAGYGCLAMIWMSHHIQQLQAIREVWRGQRLRMAVTIPEKICITGLMLHVVTYLIPEILLNDWADEVKPDLHFLSAHLEVTCHELKTGEYEDVEAASHCTDEVPLAKGGGVLE